MAAITFDRFDAGLDLRKGASVSDANRLRVLKNAYVTTGRSIRKRPGLTKIATLEAGTKGLTSGGGKLNTFYSQGVITHANSLFQPNRVPHPTTAQNISKIHYGDMFNGYLYAVVEYVDGSVWHQYLDDPGAWAASTAYALNAFRRPTTANGLRYKCTTSGTSGSSEPTWPTTIGATVNDGTAVWTCFSNQITDANCPHTKGVIKKASKMWAIKNDVVRFCATNAVRDWTTPSDAGFLPVGLQQSGATDSRALGEYLGYLVVFFSDSAQTWTVDPDPSKHKFEQRIDIGTRYHRAHANMAGDVFFLSPSGIRSITVAAVTSNLIDIDVGSPIDSVVQPLLSDTLDPIGFYFRGAGQYWVIMGEDVYVYAFSRTAKISAWSHYRFPFQVSSVTELDGVLYMRNGDDVYKFDQNTYQDGTNQIEVAVELPYLDFKQPGVLKQIYGVDAVVRGNATLRYRFDPRDETLITDGVAITGDTRPGESIPVEICAVNIAPVFEHAANESFELDAMTFYFNTLGVM